MTLQFKSRAVEDHRQDDVDALEIANGDVDLVRRARSDPSAFGESNDS